MPARVNRWIVLAAVLFAFFPIVIDMTILHIAVPSLTLALKASGSEVLWIIDIYPLIMAGLLVPMGALADRVGHRPMLIGGLATFGVASVLAAFSPTAAALIASRALLAVGGAMTIPSILAVIRATFEDPKERGVALGLWSTVSAGGAALGPLAGGFLLEHFWWGSVFLINVPVMMVVIPFIFLTVPKQHQAATQSWGFGQPLVLIAGLLTTVYAIKALAAGKGQIALLLGLLALGGLLLAWFVGLQRRSASPMLNLGLFAKPAIAVGIVMALVVSGSLTGFELTIAQELQYVIGKTPFEAGLFMIPLVIAAGVGGPIAGLLVGRFGLRGVATLSMFVSSAGLALIALSDLHDGGAVIFASLVVLGLALGIGMTASSIAIMSSVEPEEAGAAGALEATGYELGAGLGITVFGVMLATVYRGQIAMPAGLPEAAGQSIGETFVVAETLPPVAAEALRQAGRSAFGSAHEVILFAASAIIAVLGIWVWVKLRGFVETETAGH